MAITHLFCGPLPADHAVYSSDTPTLDVWVDPDCVADNGSRSKVDQAMEEEDTAQMMMKQKKTVQKLAMEEDTAQVMMMMKQQKKTVQKISSSDGDLFLISSNSTVPWRKQASTTTATSLYSAEDKENIDPRGGEYRRSLISLMPDRPLPRKPLQDITAFTEISQVCISFISNRFSYWLHS